MCEGRCSNRNSNWYENGEFPPAGTLCMYDDGFEDRIVFVIGMGYNESCVFQEEKNLYYGYNQTGNPNRFSPIEQEPS